MTFSKPFLGLGFMAWFSLSAVMMPVETQAALVTVLDNTNGGTGALSTNGTSITSSNLKAMVFSPGSSDYSLDKITLGLRRGSTGTVSFDVNLYAVDGSNVPTGAALATQTATQTLTGTAQYYTFALSHFNVVANTKYALILEHFSFASIWSSLNSNTLPTTYNGFSYIGYKLYSGGSWSNSTVYNAISLQASPVSSVPIPGAAGLFGSALAGFGLFGRRRRTARDHTA